MQKHSSNAQQLNMIRLPEVCRRLSVSRSTIYLMMAQGLFPKSVPVSARSVAWIESEVDAYISSKVSASRRDGEAA